MPATMHTGLASAPAELKVGLLEHLLGLGELQRIHARARTMPGATALDRLLAAMDARWQLQPEPGAAIPPTGPLIVAANHPCGLIDGMVLGAAIAATRPDVKLIGNRALARIPGLDGLIIHADLADHDDARRGNSGPLRAVLRHLRGGGALSIFPAGEGSRWRPRYRRVHDRPWHAHVARLARLADAPVVPAFLEGGTSALYHAIGWMHPAVRMALLPRELLRARGTTTAIHVGAAVPPAALAALGEPQAGAWLLQARSDALRPVRATAATHAPLPPVVAPQPAAPLCAEVDALPADAELVRLGRYRVLLTRREQSPGLVQETGRLRELTFRAAGEGTGAAVDLDTFDDHYWHLLLWDDEAREIAGGYRLAVTDGNPTPDAARRLYTHTLFRYDERFLRRLGPAVELGRSFVAPAHQKGFSPLLLLWQGIGRFVLRHPHCRKLFGPVSIAGDYRELSRRALVEHLLRGYGDRALAGLIAGRVPPHFGPALPHERGLIAAAADHLDRVEFLVRAAEGGRGVPVLVRQYLKLSAKAVAVNVDRRFSSAIDVMIVVDLAEVPLPTLSRYLGPDGAAQFLARHHAADDDVVDT